MTKEDCHCVRMTGIEQRVTPGQPSSAHAEHATAHEPAPLADGHDEIRHVRTFEVTPAQVTRITAHEQTIRGRNALEKVVVLRVKAADQLELPSARPALAPADGRERIHSQIAYAIRSRLHGVASEKAN